MTDRYAITCPRCGLHTHEVIGEDVWQSLTVRPLGDDFCRMPLPLWEPTDMICRRCGEPVALNGMVHFKQGWSAVKTIVSVGPRFDGGVPH